MLHIFSRWRSYPPSARRRLLQLAILLPLADLLLRIAGFARVQRWLQIGNRNSRGSTPNAEDPQQLAELARLVGHRHPWSTRCLPQAIVVAFLLRRQGRDARIVIGVARPLDQAPAHAWVELAGVALDPHAAGHRAFAHLERMPKGLAGSGPVGLDGPRLGILLALALLAALASGIGPWAVRADVATRPQVPSAQAVAEASQSMSRQSTHACPAPWARPRPDSHEFYQAAHRFGPWPLIGRLSPWLVWLGIFALALLGARAVRPEPLAVLCAGTYLLLAGIGALAALGQGHWLELLAGSQAAFPWLLALVGGSLASPANLRRCAWLAISLLAVQLVFAPHELTTRNSSYAMSLFGQATPRMVGSFDVPVSLGIFAVCTWAMALCWARLSWRAMLPLSVLVMAMLIGIGSATAWATLLAVLAFVVYARLGLRLRILMCVLALPTILALWMALPTLSGRSDVHNSLWGRIDPAVQLSREHLQTHHVLLGYRFGVGTQAYEPLRLLASNRVEPPELRPPTDSLPAVLYWQTGLLGLLSIYALLLLALIRDAPSRPLGVALIIGSASVSLAELFPLSIVLGLWLARAASPSARRVPLPH